MNAQSSKWAKDNRELVNQRKRKHRADNLEDARKYGRDWHRNNPIKSKAQGKRYYHSHKAERKANSIQWIEKNRERYLNQQVQYNKDNSEKKYKIRFANRMVVLSHYSLESYPICSKCGEKLQVTIIDNNENIETNNDKEDRWEFGTETVEEIYKPYNFSDDLRKLSSLYQRIPSYIKVAFLILIISIGLLFFLFPYIWGDFIIIWVQDRLNCYSKFNCDVYYLGENSDFLVRFIFSLFWLFIGISALVIINSFIFIIYTSFVPIKDSFKKRFATTLQNKISYYL